MTRDIWRIATILVTFAVTVTNVAAGPSRTEGLAAWEQMYSVLTHPRCINCHTATGHPDQGNDRHRHVFNIVRGPANQGVPGLTFAACHQ
ncbi:MAG TPA: hypothetical protein VG498_03155, partial [Terriglobales bacterium]|nr:hypothetical protein [Terriglobales bacterium]